MILNSDNKNTVQWPFFSIKIQELFKNAVLIFRILIFKIPKKNWNTQHVTYMIYNIHFMNTDVIPEVNSLFGVKQLRDWVWPKWVFAGRVEFQVFSGRLELKIASLAIINTWLWVSKHWDIWTNILTHKYMFPLLYRA